MSSTCASRESVLSSTAACRGWKLPETTLIYPWIVRKFPQARYIYWVRDPRDSILRQHKTDDLSDFGVPYERTSNIREMRAISWKYQSELYKSTPEPEHIIEIRFEDFVLKQDKTLRRLESFLGIPLARIEVRPDSVGRWRKDHDRHDFEFFRDELINYGYTGPANGG